MLFKTSRTFKMASELQWLFGNGSICWSVGGRETCDKEEEDEDGVSGAGVNWDIEEEKELGKTMGTGKGASEVEEAGSFWLGVVINESKDRIMSYRSVSRAVLLSCVEWLSCCGCCCCCCS